MFVRYLNPDVYAIKTYVAKDVPLIFMMNQMTGGYVLNVKINILNMKKIVIMGATSGIGLRVAEKLAGMGWLVGAAGRKEEALAELKSRFPENVVTAQIDITRAGSPKELLKLIQEMEGMDVYFHVAGIGYENFSLNLRDELNTMETNVVGFTRMMVTAYRYFRDTGCRGRIAAVTSVAGTNGIGRLASYSSSKRFQQTYLRALNQLATIDGIDVKFTDIRPGWIRTPLLNPDEEYPLTMRLPYAVSRITSALLGGKRVAVVDWRWNLIVGLWRLIPNALWVKIPMPISSPAKTEAQEDVNEIEAADDPA